MELWNMAFDAWNAIDREFPKGQDLTTDQKIAHAQTLALLAIGQELSKIHHEGINPEYDNGI